MTSNVAFNPAASAASPVVTTTGDIAGLFNTTAPSSRGPSAPIQRQGQLLAAGLGRQNKPPAPSTMMKGWHERLKPGGAKPANVRELPVAAPTRNKNSGASALLSKDYKRWDAPGVPGLNGPLKGALMIRLDQALTPQRVQVFRRLSPEQQTTALTLLDAALSAMSLPAGSAGHIDPKYMSMVVETALKYAQQTPAVLDGGAKPHVSTPATQPVPAAQTPTTERVPPAQTARTPTTERVAPAQAQRAPAAPSVPSAPTTSWSDKKISDKVDELARKQGLSNPIAVALMKDLLINPVPLLTQRTSASGQKLAHGAVTIRRAFNLASGTELGPAVAERIGMPASELVARIGAPDDAKLGQRVIARINPDHRERVATALLTVPNGTKRQFNVLRVLDQMFRSGDPKISDKELAKVYDGVTHSLFQQAINTLSTLFKKGRIEMLRTLGFTHVQILDMSLVGKELLRRLDPALGKYSPAEQTSRRGLNLPNNAEEAAGRILSARYGSQHGVGAALSYRDQIVFGMLSDKPWLMGNEMNDLIYNFNPKIYDKQGESSVTHLFMASSNFLNPPIHRGAAKRFLDRDYRHDTQKKLLQIFGLGARSLASGELEPIPTDFKVGQSPSPTAPYTPALTQDKLSNTAQPDQVHWRELLPLLQAPAGKSGVLKRGQA